MMSIRRIHPGVYLKDILGEMKMTSREFSARTGISERTLSSIMNESGKITFDVAYKLSMYFDNSVNFWTNLQTQYDLYLKEEEEAQDIEKDWKLIKNIKKYLIELGHISLDESKESIVKKCRSLAGVTSLTLLEKKDSFVCLKEQHIKSENDYFSQNFWIALALNKARKKNDVTYNRKLLLNSIKEIRGMTNEDPFIFYPRLEELLSKCGISFVLLPYLTKSNIYGATKWFSKENVMLAISNRGEKADLFWFTLFHEISHVLMEHRRETLINMAGTEDEEADRMASEMLIPNDEWSLFVDRNCFNAYTIRAFADKVGIHPCIVLGRLHREKSDDVPYGKFDNLFSLSYKIEMN